MLCEICLRRLRGVWDPTETERLGPRPPPDRYPSPSPRERTPSSAESSEADVYETTPPASLRRSSFRSNSTASGDSETEELDTEHPFHYMFGHHVDLPSLTLSVSEGCDICELVYDIFRKTRANIYDIPFTDYVSTFCVTKGFGTTWKGGHAYRLEFYLNGAFFDDGASDGRHGSAYYECTLDIVPDDDPDLHVVLDNSTDSPRTWQLVQSWVTECMQSHASCSNPSGFLPTRLLQLEGGGTFRLVDGAECAARAQYAALSYCWGPEPADTKFRLLQTNVDTLRDPMPIDRLPLTYQHAFAVVEKFGMTLLWIDRLCIVQDSAADWGHEAAQMDSVYKHCAFVISAHGAENDQKGLFFSRDPRQVILAKLKVGLLSRERRETLVLTNEKYEKWATDFQVSPSMDRGWIVQERLLAPRTIYYGRNQVFWECNARRCCEGRPGRAVLVGDLSPSKSNPIAPPIWRPALKGAMRGLAENPLAQLFMDWESTVEEYSACQLTFAKDKLVALEGLANDLRARVAVYGSALDTYLAGIWLESLPTGLMWTTEAGPYESYVAPSWSWASIGGQVSFSWKWKYKYRGCVQTLLARVGGPNAAKENVRQGKLVLEGHLFPVDVLPDQDQQSSDDGVPGETLSLVEQCLALEAYQLRAMFDNGLSDDARLYCLPIQHNHESSELCDDSDVDGLLLVPSKDGFMRRVGIFSCRVENDWLDLGILQKDSEETLVTVV